MVSFTEVEWSSHSIKSFKNFRRPNCRSETRKFKGKTRYLFISLSPYYMSSPKAKKNSEEIQCYEVLLVNPWGQVGLREKKTERKKWKNVKGPFYSDESFFSHPPPPTTTPKPKKIKNNIQRFFGRWVDKRRSSPTAAILSPKSAQRIVISGRYRLGSGYEIPVNLIKYVLHMAEPFFLAYIKNT